VLAESEPWAGRASSAAGQLEPATSLASAAPGRRPRPGAEPAGDRAAGSAGGDVAGRMGLEYLSRLSRLVCGKPQRGYLPPVCSVPVRYPAGQFARTRRLEPLLPPWRVKRRMMSARAARAVLVWAVLAGLFFMHGAASPAGGCHGGAQVTSAVAAVMPAMPGAVAARAVSAASPLAVSGMADSAARPGLRAVPPAPAVLRATSLARGSQGDGMLCSSRQPRQAYSSGTLALRTSAAVSTAAPAPPGPGSFPRRARPPGAPGLPLPLFLGVSRT
jgi:hypothetical protein